MADHDEITTRADEPARRGDEPARRVRASDAERERVAEALRGHAVAGRLDATELEDRLGRAYGARTRGDLVPLLADLPVAPPPPPRAPRQLPRYAPLIAVSILLVAIWALTGAGYFWPVWPIGAMALGALKHGRCSGLGAPQRRAHGAGVRP